MHGAVKGQGGLARLVDVGNRLDEGSISLFGKAMVVDDVIETVRPSFLSQAGLALGLVHLEENIPLCRDALADALADDVLLVFIVVAAASRDHKGLEGFLGVMLGKGRQLNNQGKGNNQEFHNA